MAMRKSTLHLDNLGEMLEASPDALRKGQQQFETPPEIAAALCTVLPKERPVIADLQCGHGNLLRAGANTTTTHVLGADIDPTAHCHFQKGGIWPEVNLLHGDIGKIFPLLAAVNTRFDLLVLNPPFSLRWKTEAFTDIPGMADSIRAAQFGCTGSRGVPMIDSTLATFFMALDRLSKTGEGMMICNEATARRLIAPTEQAQKIWLWLTLPNFFGETITQMEIAVLYFAKDHQCKTPHEIRLDRATPALIRDALAGMNRRKLINGSTIDGGGWMRGDAKKTTVAPFQAVADEWKRLKDEELGKRQWNIELRPNGKIGAWLTPFERLTGKAPKELVEELQSLNGKRPMELVVTRDQREALRRAVEGDIWRVQPALQKAVAEAIDAYNAIRAPFVRLNPVQRLGYLDEQDTILCTFALDGFIAGNRYPLRSETIENIKIEERKHPETKVREEVEVSGQELLFCIQDEHQHWHSFTQHEIELRDSIAARHDLATLLNHFEIPEVPDVSEARPAVYQEYLRRLTALEAA